MASTSPPPVRTAPPEVWDNESGQVLLTLHDKGGGVLDLAYSPDGSRLITASVDNTVSVWNAVSGEHLGTLHGHASSVLAVASSPDTSILQPPARTER